MSNKIKLNKQENETTYWINSVPGNAHTIPVNKLFESKKTEDVIRGLLSEFTQSDTEQKKRYEILLREWLNNMNDDSLDINETEKIRDLIYEMF
jgi:hypothetical protein